MTRLARMMLALVLIAAVLDSAGFGQQTVPDKVYYRDKKDGTTKSAEGELKAGPAGYQIGTGKNVVVIAPSDIVRVVPGDLPSLERKDILAQAALEEKRDWAKARDGYAEMKKNAKSPPEKTARYLEFKIAQSTARAADDAKDDESWKPQAEAAVKMLDSFLVGNTTGWEVWPAARSAAGLQADLGQFEAMASMWAKLASSKDIPADLRWEAMLNEIDAKIRAKRFNEAKMRADELSKTIPEGPFKQRLAIYQLAANGEKQPPEAIKAIEGVIAKTQDPTLRATAYSMLGELYLLGDKPNPREAMWAFLWVEVAYNQDKDAVLMAMVRLATVFTQQGDDDRAKAYREKARRFRSAM